MFGAAGVAVQRAAQPACAVVPAARGHAVPGGPRAAAAGPVPGLRARVRQQHSRGHGHGERQGEGPASTNNLQDMYQNLGTMFSWPSTKICQNYFRRIFDLTAVPAMLLYIRLSFLPHVIIRKAMSAFH